jgi:hypothetical protein
MKTKPLFLPKPIGDILSILPGLPQTMLFVQTVNLVLGDTLRSEVLRPLHGKLISIQQALEDKMKLTPQQIGKACKIGECKP